jgi:uncharacterized membrane protein YGL010W
MRKIDQLLNEYGQSHQNLTNKAIHWICVPIIFWSIVALLYAIPHTWFLQFTGNELLGNWAAVALLFVGIYYIRLSPALFIGMLVFSNFCLFIAALLQASLSMPLWQLAIGAFVIAWVGQFYGHHIEGKKPSFLKDLQFLLIGPAWLLHFMYKKLRIRY